MHAFVPKNNNNMSYHRVSQQQQILQNQVSENPIGAQLSAVDRASIKATDKFRIASKTMKNNRERLAEMIKFVQEKYPTYSRECVREISEEDKNNDRYNWFEAKYDFIYEHLHSDTIKAFMAGKN